MDLLRLRLAYHYRPILKLVDDLAKVGDTEAEVAAYLGHPIREMTTEEYDTLAEYLTRAQEAAAKGRGKAGVRPKPLPKKQTRKKK